MNLSDFLNNPLIVGVVVLIPSFILGLLAYRRSVKVDAATEKSGIITTQTTAVQQVIDGLNQLIANLQEDNKLLRASLDELRVKLEELVVERTQLRTEIDGLHKKYDSKNLT